MVTASPGRTPFQLVELGLGDGGLRLDDARLGGARRGGLAAGAGGGEAAGGTGHGEAEEMAAGGFGAHGVLHACRVLAP